MYQHFYETHNVYLKILKINILVITLLNCRQMMSVLSEGETYCILTIIFKNKSSCIKPYIIVIWDFWRVNNILLTSQIVEHRIPFLFFS